MQFVVLAKVMRGYEGGRAGQARGWPAPLK